MNYLRRSCLEDVERSLRSPEQVQCLRFLCYTGSKQEAQARWQNKACGIQLKKKKSPLLEAAIPDDIQSNLV
jgi:hypothetical protein